MYLCGTKINVFSVKQKQRGVVAGVGVRVRGNDALEDCFWALRRRLGNPLHMALF